MLKNSNEAYLLTDKTKITDRFKVKLCDFFALTGVISDFEFSEETKKIIPKSKIYLFERIKGCKKR